MAEDVTDFRRAHGAFEHGATSHAPGKIVLQVLHREHSPELMGCANRMSGSSSFNLTNALAAVCALGAPRSKKRTALKLAFPMPAMEVQRIIESR